MPTPVRCGQRYQLQLNAKGLMVGSPRGNTGHKMNYLGFVRLLTADHTSYSSVKESVRARQTAEAQIRIYQELAGIASNIVWPAGSTNRPSAHNLRANMEGFLRDKISTTEGHNLIRLGSPLPIIDEAEFEAWKQEHRVIAQATMLDANRASAFIVAGILHEGFERQGIPRRFYDEAEPDVISAMLRFSELKHWNEQLTSADSDFAARFNRLATQSETYASAIEAERDQYKEDAVVRITHLNMLEEKAKSVEASVSQIELRLKETEEAFQKRLSDLEASIRDELELNTMRVLWKDRADEAQKALRNSVLFVGAMAIAAFAFAIFCGHAVIDFISPFNFRTIVLNSSAAGAISQQLGRVVIVSIPAVVYFWVMKIAVRFIIRSLLLMDDARQRQTIMDSYFLLTKEGKSDERALPMMLWALFRQVPGHGSDGIEPPDFTEAINAGLKNGMFGKP